MIFDVFSYYDEADILEVRLATLADVPDMLHVAIESTETLAGDPKPLYLDDDRDRFEPWGLRRWIAEPPLFRVPTETAHDRERVQRNQGLRALEFLAARPDDLVLFGDVDEIPEPVRLIEAAGIASEDGDPLVSLRMNYHSLLATWYLPLVQDWCNHRWPVLGTVRRVREEGGLAEARELSEGLQEVTVGGWHLSSMGGPELVIRKAHAFAHHDEDWVDSMTADRLREFARRGRDVANRLDQVPYKFGRLPRPIREDPERYRVLLDCEAW